MGQKKKEMPARQIGPLRKQVRNTRKPASQRTSRISWIWTSAQSRLISATSLESLGRGRRGSNLDWDRWRRPTTPSCCRSGCRWCGSSYNCSATSPRRRPCDSYGVSVAGSRQPADRLPRRLCAPASGPRSVRWPRFFMAASARLDVAPATRPIFPTTQGVLPGAVGQLPRASPATAFSYPKGLTTNIRNLQLSGVLLDDPFRPLCYAVDQGRRKEPRPLATGAPVPRLQPSLAVREATQHF